MYLINRSRKETLRSSSWGRMLRKSLLIRLLLIVTHECLKKERKLKTNNILEITTWVLSAFCKYLRRKHKKKKKNEEESHCKMKMEDCEESEKYFDNWKDIFDKA